MRASAEGLAEVEENDQRFFVKIYRFVRNKLQIFTPDKKRMIKIMLMM